jgi:Domain of unknown function (DUF1707)
VMAGRDLGHMRAAHADRERVVGTLKAAFVQGRLDRDELDTRVGAAFAARTYGELAALTADIPAEVALAADAGPVAAGPVAAGPVAAGPVAAKPASTPGRTLAKASRRAGVCALAVIALVWIGILTGSLALLLPAALAFIAACGFFGYGVVDAVQEMRSRGRLPSRPASLCVNNESLF